ncbi:hypothetical protein BYT27DRAFT_7255935 [Phlegmacium glaucopus]|nr:hypothetical protein BYT27DRAFT_7255935 [Phlegmacium glaucopus]
MTSYSQPIDLSPEPDLSPLYPTISQISQQISSHSGLDPSQKAKLVSHCLTRSCTFGDISIIQYLLSDPQTQAYVDLGLRDEDGVNLISLAIQGFGGDADRDVEREECVRLLVSQGADVTADNAGWTPLHYAAIFSPPSLVSYLMTHGCSAFALTARKLTALDIVTAQSTLPGKEDVALLLEEAMRGQGWAGGRMEQKRRLFDQRMKKKGKRKTIREDIGKTLGIGSDWWGKDSESDESDSDDDEDGVEDLDERVYTPIPDYTSMLVFSPPLLPQIFDSLISNFSPKWKDATPANTLYMLARFACLTCDHIWLEELIIGAADAIEETFFNRAEDLSCLVFWLYNATLWLHLLQCDTLIHEACEMLGSFELIEEVINSVFVFIIRFAERRIDQLLDDTILTYTPLASEFEAIQFESEWSFLRPFSSKRKGAQPSPGSRSNVPSPPPSPYLPISPSKSQVGIPSSTSRGLSSLRQTLSRARGQSSVPLSSLFQDSPIPSPLDLTSFMTSLHTLLVMSNINPAIITQLWSQIIYWTSCEIFNRVITRKKYICRSRAFQISMNLTAIEEWIEEMGMSAGIQLHFAPVRDLLNWLQCLSSITEFPDLVATIQTMKNVNPLQMRRAVRDYKYEVNEGRMTDECIQYLTQLQKDWERHRVKLEVEALRKEIGERDRDREGSISSLINDTASVSSRTPSITASIATFSAQQSIDMLFDRSLDKSTWEPIRPPQALGELLDSRHMLPLLFPSNPRLLAALPGNVIYPGDSKRTSVQSSKSDSDKSSSHANAPEPFSWRSRNRKVREIGIEILQWVDGVRSASRWGRSIAHDFEDGEEAQFSTYHTEEPEGDEPTITGINIHITPLTRKPSGRAKGRLSTSEVTPINGTFDNTSSSNPQ